MKSAVTLLIISFIADQLFQSKTIMQDKHKSTVALFVHVLNWSIAMFIYSSYVFILTGNADILIWWFTISVIHFATEWCCLSHGYWIDRKFYPISTIKKKSLFKQIEHKLICPF